MLAKDFVRARIPNFALLLVAVLLAVVLIPGVVAMMGPQTAQAAPAAKSITVANAASGKVTMAKGTKYKLGAKAEPKGAKLKYKSSSKRIVSISSKGILRGKNVGKAKVTISGAKGHAKKTVKVTVVKKSKYVKVKKIAVSAPQSLNVGATSQVKAAISPKKASNKNLLYKSSNSAVLKVGAKGKLTAKKTGSATITVTSCANRKAKDSVRVKVWPKTTPSSKFIYEIRNDNELGYGVYIEGYKGTAKNIVLPNKIKGTAVVSAAFAPKRDATDGTNAYTFDSIDPRQAKSLKLLDLEDLPIKSVDLSGNPNLRWLGITNCDLRSLNVSHNPKLRLITVENNAKLASLDVSHNPTLLYLVCNSTAITSIDVSHNPKLYRLWVSHTGITGLNLANNPKLGDLQCDFTGISSLDLSHNQELDRLQCNDTRITSLDLSNNRKLTELHCQNTGITQLDLSNQTYASLELLKSNVTCDDDVLITWKDGSQTVGNA
ncbi:MAG: Ig-like domain-containing protein [Eggerthellaceae bacterium]|jgi:hypothetical protein